MADRSPFQSRACSVSIRDNDNMSHTFLNISGGSNDSTTIFSLRYWTKRIGALLKGLFVRKPNKSFPSKTTKKTSVSNNTTDKRDSKTVKNSLNNNPSGKSSLVRIQKELQDFLARPPSLCKVTVGSNIRIWTVSITWPEGTIYAGETYQLYIKFTKDYPSKPPIVYFLKPTPRHVHVYSNGDICLNLIGRDWRPSMTAESIVISIQSMLSSAKEKKIPPDNVMHSENPPGLQQEGWMYHDDKC